MSQVIVGRQHHNKPLMWLLVLMCVLFQSAHADIIKEGDACIPGHPGKIVHWMAKHRKPPLAGKAVQFWMELTLKNPAPGDDIKFIVCCMLNLKKPKIDHQLAYRADVSNGTWTCTQTGEQKWYPNYHFGCRRIELKEGGVYPYFRDWFENPYDATVEFSEEFTEDELADPYFDFAIDCPNGFSGCDVLFDKQNKWLVPGVGGFPQNPNASPPCTGGNMNGTASYWIGTNGMPPVAGMRSSESFFPTGNWYTMAYMENNYPSILEGGITNLPIGSSVQLMFPPSAGTTPQKFIATAESMYISVPFMISDSLMNDADEHTYFRVSFPESAMVPNPHSTIEFKGQVTAAAPSFFPNGDTLFRTGQMMHGIQLQFAVDDDLPYVVSRQVTPTDSGFLNVSVRAADATTMASAASLRYSVDGGPPTTVPIPYDFPSADAETTHFFGKLGPVSPSSQVDYTILLADDARNESANSNLGLIPGWNMISVPVQSTSNTVSALFPHASSTAFRYQSGYVPTSNLNPGVGYWLKVDSLEDVLVRGRFIVSDTIDVAAGWNMIGSVSDPTLTSTITSLGTTITSQFFGYNGGYYPTALIRPGSAYWVKVTSSGQLVLAGATKKASPVKPAFASSTLEKFSKITFEDAEGHRQDLYVGPRPDSRASGDLFALPPRPPEGSFDVRFVSNCMVETFDRAKERTTTFPFIVTSSHYPITLTWELSDESDDKLFIVSPAANGNLRIPLRGRGSAKIIEPQKSALAVSVEPHRIIPKEYSLGQNYPNPFNPTTRFTYVLPVDGLVSLKIFNVLGQEIATVVDAFESAGYKSSSFDASRLPSGLYFYRLQAGKFTDTKKMMLVK